jgi:hypothetical protein
VDPGDSVLALMAYEAHMALTTGHLPAVWYLTSRF